MGILHNILQNILAAIILPLVSVGGFFTQANTLVVIPPRPAIISVLPAELKAQLPSPATTTALISTATETKTAENNSVIQAAQTSTPKIAPNNSSAKIEPKSTPAPTPAISELPTTVTPKKNLDKTALSLNQRFDGSYWVALRTNLSDSTFDWTLSKTTVNGFGISYSCDPQPDLSSPDGEPSFQIRKSYNCDISLSGKNGQKETKRFSFQTGPGRLIASVASGMQTVLKDDKNESGFAFNNQDDFPVSITGLTFDVSFTALSTSTLVAIRFADPVKETSLADYNIQNIPVDISRPYSSAGTNIKVSFSGGFIIKEHDQKMILVQAIGVRKSPFLGVDPEIKITLKHIDTDRNDTKESVSSAVVLWKCTAPQFNKPAGELSSDMCTQ